MLRPANESVMPSSPTHALSSLRKQKSITRAASFDKHYWIDRPNDRCQGLWIPASAGTTECDSRAAILGCKLRCLMLRGQRIDQFVKRVTGDHLRQLVQRQIDAVIGDSTLGKIVGADAL